MCFSAEADLVAGVVIVAIGIDAVRHVQRPAHVALASLPLVLGAHQLIEVGVWSSLQGNLSEPLGDLATVVYLTIAFSVLPILIPVAVGRLDPTIPRRLRATFILIGVAVAVGLTAALVRERPDAMIHDRHIEYDAHLWHGGALAVGYVVATCGPLLVSPQQRLRWFGFANVAASAILAWIDQTAFVSLWCLWAAVGSAGVAGHLRLSTRQDPSVVIEHI